MRDSASSRCKSSGRGALSNRDLFIAIQIMGLVAPAPAATFDSEDPLTGFSSTFRCVWVGLATGRGCYRCHDDSRGVCA
jgi:hypothetical protein